MTNLIFGERAWSWLYASHPLRSQIKGSQKPKIKFQGKECGEHVVRVPKRLHYIYRIVFYRKPLLTILFTVKTIYLCTEKSILTHWRSVFSTSCVQQPQQVLGVSLWASFLVFLSLSFLKYKIGSNVVSMWLCLEGASHGSCTCECSVRVGSPRLLAVLPHFLSIQRRLLMANTWGSQPKALFCDSSILSLAAGQARNSRESARGATFIQSVICQREW